MRGAPNPRKNPLVGGLDRGPSPTEAAFQALRAGHGTDLGEGAVMTVNRKAEVASQVELGTVTESRRGQAWISCARGLGSVWCDPNSLVTQLPARVLTPCSRGPWSLLVGPDSGGLADVVGSLIAMLGWTHQGHRAEQGQGPQQKVKTGQTPTRRDPGGK